MELNEYKKDSYEFSKLTSDLVRQFAFAGIAIIWIFKVDKSDHLIPNQLFLPLLFLVIALVFDLLQYLIPTIIWTIFFRYHEKKNNGDTRVQIKASSRYSAPGWTCFTLKIICLIVSYVFIISFIIHKI